jgi:hypothetical protein
MASIFGSQTDAMKNQSFRVNKSPKVDSSILKNSRSRVEITMRESNTFKREKVVPYSTDKIDASLSRDFNCKMNRNKSINSKQMHTRVKDSSFDGASHRNSSKEIRKRVSSLLKTANHPSNYESKGAPKTFYKSSNDLLLMDRFSSDAKGIASVPLSSFSKLLNSKADDNLNREGKPPRQSPSRALKNKTPTHYMTSLAEMNNSRQMGNRTLQSRLNSHSQNNSKHLSRTSENIAQQQKAISSLTRIPRDDPFKQISTSQFYERPAHKTSKASCAPKGQIITESKLSIIPSLTFGSINNFLKSYENKSEEVWPLSERGDLTVAYDPDPHSNPKFFSKVRQLMAHSLKPKLPN